VRFPLSCILGGALVFIIVADGAAAPKIQAKTVEYRTPGVVVKGYLAFKAGQPIYRKKRRTMAAKIRPRLPAKTFMTGPLLTVSEAAKYLGVGRKEIYRLIEWGEIKAVKLGRSVQVTEDSLDHFKASGKLT
jgi:excisionase family DNA binding protein